MHVRVRVPPRTAKLNPAKRAKFPPKIATFPHEESYVSPRRELSFPPTRAKSPREES